MTSSDISKRVSELYQRVQDLRTQSLTHPDQAIDILSDALKGLEASLEELSTAEEELYQQNEELIEAAEEREKHLTEIYEAHEALRRQSEMLEQSPVLIRDLDDRIITWCQGVEKLYGWTSDEALGQISHDLFRTEFPEPLEDIKARVMKDGVWSGDLSHITRDGRRINVSSQWILHKDDSCKPIAIIEVNKDITERKLREDLSRATNQINQLIHSTLDLEDITQRVISEASQALGSETAAISLRQDDAWIVRYVHGFPEDVVGTRMKDEQEPHAVLAVRTKKPVAINDAFNDDRVNREHVKQWGIRSVLVVPLISKDQAIGVIFFNYQKQPFNFSQAHVDFAQRLASSISLAIENAQLFESIQMELKERKKAEEELRQSEERFRLVLQNTPVVVANLDRDLRYTWVYNPKGGFSPEEVLGKTIGFSTDSETAERMTESLHNVLISGVPIKWETTSKTGTGEISLESYAEPLRSIDGEIKGIALVSIDITERKRAEKEREKLLREVEAERARLQAILDSLPVGVTIADATGCILVNNDALRKIWGGKAPLSKCVEEYVEYKGWWSDTGEAIKPEEWGLARAITKGEISVGEVIDIQRFDGTRGTMLNSAAPVRDAGGKIIGAVVILQDITEHKQMEEDLRKSREELELRVRERTSELSQAKEELEVINEELHVELEQHQKVEAELTKAKDQAMEAVEAKASFLANMSHELRTPMNAVIGFTGLLLDDSLTPEQMDYIEGIRKGGEALLALINDILDVSKAEKQKIELEHQSLSIRALVEESMELVAPDASEKGLDLSYTVSYGTPDAIVGDHGRLRQILVNLLSNAVKFTDQGEVAVSVSSKPLKENKRRYLFEVRDTGIGIPEDKMDRLFQPFGQVEHVISRKRDGAGLGLAICKNLVQLMGGEIWAQSEPGMGSTFRFTIPAEVTSGKHLDLGVSDQKSASESPTEMKPMSILVAEDNPSNQRVLMEMLRRMGHKVDAVADGKEVLQVLKIRSYDLVLMDVKMPEMDGITATREIRKAWPAEKQPRIIAITAYAMDGDREMCLEAGMDDYIAKPVQRGELAEVLKRCSYRA